MLFKDIQYSYEIFQIVNSDLQNHTAKNIFDLVVKFITNLWQGSKMQSVVCSEVNAVSVSTTGHSTTVKWKG